MGSGWRPILDKTIPYFGVLMTKKNLDSYPRCALPEGFTLSGYKPGFEEAWARLMFELGQTDSSQEARDIFRKEFLSEPALLQTRCLFLLDAKNALAATASLWHGNHFGRELLRIHWVACAGEYQGRGLAKALLTALLDIARALNYRDTLYLTSQTWSYKALHLYARFGFEPYLGPKPANWKSQTGDFAEETQEAWNLIQAKINARSPNP